MQVSQAEQQVGAVFAFYGAIFGVFCFPVK